MNKVPWFAVGVGVACVAVAAFVAVSSSHALGFRNPDQGAAATAQGEAFAAQADDASAIYYNPAGLTQVEGTQFTSGGYIVFRDIQFKGSGTSDDIDATSFLPHLYVASDFGLERWRFGLGMNIPFGNDVDWGDTGPFQEIVTESSLTVLNIAPTLAYKVNDHLSMGVGLNVYLGDTELQNRPFTTPGVLPFPFPDTKFKFDGDGDALGATVGLMWKINEKHTLAAVYRSPFRIDFDGDAHLTNPPPVPIDPGPTSASTSIDFPQSATIAYAFRPVPRLKLEVDIEWTNWETLDTVRLDSTNVAFDGYNIPFDWEDSLFYEFGVEYKVCDEWVVRAGYIFSENTVPESTFSPSQPDSDRHVFSVGIGYSSAKPLFFGKFYMDVDIAYQYAVSEDRTIDSAINSEVNGDWESSSHAVIFTSTIRF